MVSSVHTNMSALAALQNLNSTNRELEQVQNRVNTGLKVAGAKDNSAVFAVAQNMRADIGAYGSVKASLDRAIGISDVTLAAGQSISDLLVQMREKIVAALDPSINTASRQAYNADFQALKRQITTVVRNATFDGANLLNGSVTTAIRFLGDADATAGSVITLASHNLTFGGTILSLSGTSSLGTVAASSTARVQLDNSLKNLNLALARLGSDAKKIEAHAVFVTKLTDTLTGGVSNLVDADLARESARLQALQVKQQLGVQALSIANGAPQAILALFRG